MSEEQKPTEVTNEDLELAIRVVIEWHAQKKLAFAVVNSGSGLMVSAGNAFELEAALSHAHKLMEHENAIRLIELRQRHHAAAEAGKQ